MSKEYKAYRFFVLIYVSVIANIALLLAEGANYYIWFCSSLVLLSVLLIKERIRILDLLKLPSSYKLSRESIFLLPFIITYPRHYQLYRHLDYVYVALLQLINILLFIFVFCVRKKSVEIEKI